MHFGWRRLLFANSIGLVHSSFYRSRLAFVGFNRLQRVSPPSLSPCFFDMAPTTRPVTVAAAVSNDADNEESFLPQASPRKRARKSATKSSPSTKKKAADAIDLTESPPKRKASDHQRQTETDEIPKLWGPEQSRKNGSYTYKIGSWNVAGLRALLRKEPQGLANLCKKYDLDMLCLQETKLQEMHLDDPKLKIRGHLLEEEGYDSYYSCSTTKKGYSGTAVFIKRENTNSKSKKQSSITTFFGKKNGNATESTSVEVSSKQEERPNGVSVSPVDVSYGIGKEIDGEGRVITVHLPFASITNVYVPNSGQTLQRLDYRCNEWDKDFLTYHQKLEKKRNLPVIWLGDLNVAHKAYDVWNDGAKHLVLQAGVTPQERASFQSQLDSGYIDAFRHLHPSAKGHYSYWSQRAGNRGSNKGLRLDYFICSPSLFSDDSNVVVRDSYMVPEQLGSDHCPVILELELKQKPS